MIVVQYEYWRRGSASAIFADRAAALAALEENLTWHMEESEASIEDLIASQIRWLNTSEQRIGSCEQREIESWYWREGETMEERGALWSGRR
jgi:hypothetical protein